MRFKSGDRVRDFTGRVGVVVSVLLWERLYLVGYEDSRALVMSTDADLTQA